MIKHRNYFLDFQFDLFAHIYELLCAKWCFKYNLSVLLVVKFLWRDLEIFELAAAHTYAGCHSTTRINKLWLRMSQMYLRWFWSVLVVAMIFGMVCMLFHVFWCVITRYPFISGIMIYPDIYISVTDISVSHGGALYHITSINFAQPPLPNDIQW